MLMLSRNIGKAVIIGGNIRVTVTQVNGCQVRLGIDAPRGVIIDREEIHQRRLAEGAGQEAPEFNIDDHVKLVADARRYRWLRQHSRIEDAVGTLIALSGKDSIADEEIDREIDNALRIQAKLQQAALAQEVTRGV